jgi:hypothetical protein
MHRMTDHNNDQPEDGENYVTFHLMAQRLPHTYVMSIIIPLLLVSMLSFNKFSSSFTSSNTDSNYIVSGRAQVIIALVLAANVLKGAVSEKLPKVSYSSILDKYILLTNVWMTLCAFEDFVVYWVYRQNGPDIANTFDWISLICFAITWVILQVWFVVTVSITISRNNIILEQWKNLPGKRERYRLGKNAKRKGTEYNTILSIDDNSKQQVEELCKDILYERRRHSSDFRYLNATFGPASGGSSPHFNPYSPGFNSVFACFKSCFVQKKT